MLLQDVKDLITRSEFDAARSQLENFIGQQEGDKMEAFQLLLFITQNDQKEKYFEIENRFLKYMQEQNQTEGLYKILKTKKLSDELNDINQALLFLDILWKLGRIQEFSDYTRELNSYLLETKRFNQYIKFYNQIIEKTQRFSFIELGFLICSVEIGDATNSIATLEKIIEQNVYSNNHPHEKKIKTLKSIQNILEEFRGNHFEIYYYKLYLKLMLTTFGKESFSMKESIEFSLMLKNGVHGSFLLELNSPQTIKEKIFQYLRTKYKLKQTEIPAFCKKSRSYFAKDIILTQNKIFEERKIIAPVEDQRILKEEDPILFGKNSKPKMSQIESELLKQFEFEEWSEERVETLTISFIEMEMYYVASALASRMKESSEKLYLQAEISLNLNEPADVIYFCNLAIDQYKLLEVDQIPFLYLKMKAYQISQKIKDERMMMKEIAMLDPTFMNIRSRLLL